MIVISPNIVVTGNDDGLDHPTFLWRSIVTASNVVATYEDADYPATDLANPATHLQWRSTSTAVQYLTVTTGTADNLDGVGIAAHNFGTAGIAVSIEGDDGGGFDELVAPVVPADDAPLMFRFDPAPFTAVRVKLAAGSEAPRAGALFLGKMLISPRLIGAPYTPITMGRMATGVDGISESGAYLGSIITGEHREGSIAIQYLDPDWYRANMDAFIAAAVRRVPFFFAWQPQSHPTDVGYVRVRSDPAVSIHHNDEWFQVSLDVIGTV